MLKTVKFSNFRMFKNETIIDLVPTKSEILKDSNIEECLLKGGLFYGGNASGKTTALHAISLLLDLLFKEFVFDENNICKFSKDKIAKFGKFVFDENDPSMVYNRLEKYFSTLPLRHSMRECGISESEENELLLRLKLN